MESAPGIIALALTSPASSLTSNDNQNVFSSSPESMSSAASHLQSLYVSNSAHPTSGWQQTQLQYHPSLSAAQPYLYASQYGHA